MKSVLDREIDEELLGQIPESWELPEELRFIGEYLIFSEVGSGAMGEVLRGRSVKTHRTVAVKVIKGGVSIERFKQEILTLGLLDHPNIVKIHQEGIDRGCPWFAMDFVDGVNLEAHCNGRPMNLRQAATFLEAICRALSYAHDKGVLHRDLKPSNILINPFGQALLADFGMAKVTRSAVEMTREGQPIGTPAYMAPEQMDSDHGAESPRTDVYGIGATLYQMITGVPPFHAVTYPQLMTLVLGQEPASPRVLNGSVDRDLETICLKCLRKAPDDRYQSALEVADELHRWLSNQPIVARPLTVPQRLRKWMARRPALAASIGFTIVSILVGMAGIVWQWRRAEAERLAVVSTSHQKVLEQVHRLLGSGNGHAATTLLMETLRGDPKDRAVAQRLWACLVQHPLPRRITEVSSSEDWMGILPVPGSSNVVAWSAAGGIAVFRLEDPSGWKPFPGGPFSAEPCLAPGGNWIYCGTTSGNLIRFSPQIPAETTTIRIGPGMRFIRTSRDGKHLAIGVEDGIVVVDAEAFRPVTKLSMTGVEDAQFANKVLWAAGTAGLLRHGLETGETQYVQENWGGRQIRGIRISPEENAFVVWTDRGIWRLNPRHATNPEKISSGSSNVIELEFAAEGDQLILAGPGGSMQWVDVATGEIARVVQAHSRDISAAGLHSGRLWVATGSDGGVARIWSTGQGAAASEEIPVGAPVRSVALGDDGHSLAVLTFDSTLQLWTLPRRPSTSHVVPLPLPVRDGWVTTDGHRLVAGAQRDSSAVVYNTLTGTQTEWQIPGRIDGSWMHGADGMKFAVPLESKGLLVMHSLDDSNRWIIPPGFRPEAISHTGNHIAGSDNEGVAVWETDSRVRHPLKGEGLNMAWGVFSRSGRCLVGGDRHTAWISSHPWKTTSRLTISNLPPGAIDLDPEGRHVAWAEAGSVHLKEFGAGREWLIPDPGGTTALRFSHDGELLAIGNQAGQLRLIRVSDLSSKGLPMIHGKAVNSLDFAEDGRFLASASADDRIHLWDPETGLAAADPERSAGASGVRFSTDGRSILSASGAIWRFPRWEGDSMPLAAAAQNELGQSIGGILDPRLLWLQSCRSPELSQPAFPDPAVQLKWSDLKTRWADASGWDPANRELKRVLAEAWPANEAYTRALVPPVPKKSTAIP